MRASPETCRIFTDASGAPRAFLAAVLLFKESIAAIDAVEEGAVERLLPAEYARLASLPVDAAHTYLALMVGIDPDSEEHSKQELAGFMIRDGLARLGEGARALVRTQRPDLAALLTKLGFVDYGNDTAQSAENLYRPGRVDAPDRGVLYELDLRGGRFGPWALSFLNAVDRGVPGHPTAGGLAPEHVRRLLKTLHDADEWRKSPTSALVAPFAAVFPGDLRATVIAILNGRQPCPVPLTEYDKVLLFHTYWRRTPPTALTLDLHISRATYYRHLERAVRNLCRALVAMADKRPV